MGTAEGRDGRGADSEKDSREDGMRKYGAIDYSSREEVRWKTQVGKGGGKMKESLTRHFNKLERARTESGEELKGEITCILV